jgi:hypothetical protein
VLGRFDDGLHPATIKARKAYGRMSFIGVEHPAIGEAMRPLMPHSVIGSNGVF